MNVNDKSVKNSYTERLASALSRNNTAEASRTSAVFEAGKVTPASIRHLVQGEILLGEVMNRIGSDIQLKLNDGSVLYARMDTSLPLSIGQTAFFEITQTDLSSITLRLLPEAPMAEQNALIGKALNAAGLPENERNISVVEELLRHQLSIDKESIHQLLQQSINHKNTDTGTLALMNKYHLPVNTATITQFQAYQSYEHQMLPQLTSLIHTLVEMTERDSTMPVSLQENLQKLLTSGEVSVDSSTRRPLTNVLNGSQTPEIPSLGVEEEPFLPANQTNLMNNPNQETLTIGQKAGNESVLTPSGTPIGKAENEPIVITEFNTGSSSPSTLLQNQAVLQLPLTAALLETQLLRRWTLSSKELSKDSSVKKFYQQLQTDLDFIRALLEQADSGTRSENNAESTLKQTAQLVQNLQDNLEFVNELNRIFPYFQLPLRFDDMSHNDYKLTHGELYVYTKKDSLKADQTSISVLLHLDMDHIGPTDIYLSLSSTLLTSKFYISSHNLKDLFEKHLPELKQTLVNKGLTVSYEIMTREHEVNPIQDFLTIDAPDSMKRYSFDCRA